MDPTTEALTAECEALRLKVKLAEEQAEHNKAEAGRIGELARVAQADINETDAVNSYLSELLKAIATALKGPPPDLVWHDWSDLPLLAGQLRGERDHLQSEVERLMKDPDESD